MFGYTSSSKARPDYRELDMLKELFGSTLSEEEIAIAYTRSQFNAQEAAEYLFAMLRDESSVKSEATSSEHPFHSSGTGSLSSEEYVGEMNLKGLVSKECDVLMGSPEANETDSWSAEGYVEEMNLQTFNSKKISASTGSVSGFIGKEYVRSKPFATEPREPTKPVRINMKEFSVAEMVKEENSSFTTAANDKERTDIENFLFEMLGVGFQLDKDVIRDVLGSCGYDPQKSMDKLLDMSDSTAEKRDYVVGTTARYPVKCPQEQSILHQEQQYRPDSSQRARYSTKKKKETLQEYNDRVNHSREILEALFLNPWKEEEEPKKIKIVREPRRHAFRKPVTRPLEETFEELTIVSESQGVLGEEDGEAYEALREAVQEHRTTMRAYYKAAIEAYIKGDRSQASKFTEEGHMFRQKAREADEVSTQKLIEVRREEEIVNVDLHSDEPKEACRQLKTQLTYFSGMPTFKYLRVTIGTNKEDLKGARKRLILKLLRMESISWTEEEEGLKLMIRVDVIDPKKLSFAKK